MDTQNILGEEFPPSGIPSSDEKTMAILSHVLGIFTCFIGPLIIYLLKKDDSDFVARHAKESLNFQITIFLCYFISFILVIVLIGFLLMWALYISNIVLIIVATIKTSENKLYRYPFNFRLIK